MNLENGIFKGLNLYRKQLGIEFKSHEFTLLVAKVFLISISSTNDLFGYQVQKSISKHIIQHFLLSIMLDTFSFLHRSIVYQIW